MPVTVTDKNHMKFLVITGKKMNYVNKVSQLIMKLTNLTITATSWQAHLQTYIQAQKLEYLDFSITLSASYQKR